MGDEPGDRLLRDYARRDFIRSIRGEAKGIAIVVGIVLMIFGLLHILGIERPLFSDNDQHEDIAPR